MKIGYIRVSTEEQNPVRQQVLLRELGVDEIFIDKASGKNTDRPELQRMMDYVRKGDTVIVESISRFARNTRDLLELVEQLTAKQVEFVSKKEAIDTTTPTGKFMLTVFAAVPNSSVSTSSNASARGSPSPRRRESIMAVRRSLCRTTSRRSPPSGGGVKSPRARPCTHRAQAEYIYRRIAMLHAAAE